MDEVLKNLASTVELLAVSARSDVVKQWDSLTLSRAFGWARYCEHLFLRFHSNTAIRGVLEKQLRVTNQNLEAVFPEYKDLSFPDLALCCHLLLVGLLSNPELPVSTMKILFDCKKQTNTPDQDVSGLCSRLIQCKSASKVLSPLTDSSPLGADAEVQASMLLQRLDALLSPDSRAGQAERFLDSVLRECEGASGHFSLVIAAALLTTTDSRTASHEFLLDWLQRKPSVLHNMCSALPTALLRDLAKEQPNFRTPYYNVLKNWASTMEYDLDEGEWVQSGGDQTASFLRLTEHFLALFEASPSLREELNTLKISDGDFDVRGLSVWGDLLAALSK